MTFAAMMVLALLIDAAIGWPRRLYDKIGHPVTWIGALISFIEARWNRGTDKARFWRGAACTALVTICATVPALALQLILPAGAVGTVLGAALAWPFLAARSLHEHVQAVSRAFATGDLQHARHAVSLIVGRDPAQLDQAGVGRAALESLAENASDGIVAPLFWGVVLGLPGIVAYKAVNTLDSMIGHRSARYAAFGNVAACLDDLLNLVPARLTGLAFALVAPRPKAAWRAMRRDARKHRSPNAGWPEAAMAGALHIRLSGPRAYGQTTTDESWLNPVAPDPEPRHIEHGLALYRRAMVLCAIALVGLAAAGV